MSKTGLKKAKNSWTTYSAEETELVGYKLASSIKAGDVVCLDGHLGAGKTTLLKGLIHALTNAPIDEITSPTFTYVHDYQNVHHFDLYRLNDPEEFIHLGLDEYLDDKNAINIIEWAERITPLLPETVTWIRIDGSSDETRKITLF